MSKIFSFFLLTLLTITTFSIATAQQVGDTDDGQGSCIELAYNMRFRSRDINTNGEVSDLQDFLISEGYLTGNTTGYFGALTLKAVKNFQSSNNLISSGIVGAVTRAKIKSMSCGSTISSISNNPANPISPVTPNPAPTYTSQEPKINQVFLNDKGSSENKVELTVTGSGLLSVALLNVNDRCSIGGVSPYGLSTQTNDKIIVSFVRDYFYSNCAQQDTYANIYSSSNGIANSNKYSFYVPRSNDITYSNQTTNFKLKSPTDGKPLMAGQSSTICWDNASSFTDQKIIFAISPANIKKGDGAYPLGISAFLSQKCVQFTVPSFLKSETHQISANNHDATIYSNSPSFEVINNTPDPAINSFYFSDEQKFTLSVNNVSSIQFKVECGNGVSAMQNIRDGYYADLVYLSGNESVCNEYQYYQNLQVNFPTMNITNENFVFYKNGVLAGRAWILSPQDRNISGEFVIKVKVCNIAGKCVEAQAPGKFYAKG